MTATTPDPFVAQLRAALGTAYDLEREITGGGMSRVFVARERALDRPVVVKVLPPDLAAGVNRERFRREIQLAAQLQHPHIVPLLSAGESAPSTGGGAGLLYYTMPFIEGESLRAAVEQRGAMPVRDVVRVLHDVVDAIAYAHGRGVVHRDIKPANILRSGAHSMVTDFGVAKALERAMSEGSGTRGEGGQGSLSPLTPRPSPLTTAGIAIGTPAYMAPEQLAGDPNADHRVDIYAVGLLAYELLTGESPFAGASPQATMAAQLTRDPTPLHELGVDVPPALSDIIMRCLRKSADERPQSAAALLAELESVSTPHGGVLATPQMVREERPTPALAAASGAASAAVPAVAQPSRRLRRGAVAALAAVGAIALVGGWFAFARRDRPDRASSVPASRRSDTAAAAPGAPPSVSAAPPVSAPPGAAAGAGAAAPAKSATAAPAPLDTNALYESIRKRVEADIRAHESKASTDSLRAQLVREITDSLSRELEQRRRRSAEVGPPPRVYEFRGIDSTVRRTLDSLRGMGRGYRGPIPPRTPLPGVPGAEPGARPRIVVLNINNGTGKKSYSSVLSAIPDSLRHALATRTKYDVVDEETSIGALKAYRRALSVGEALGANAVVYGTAMLRPDSLVLVLEILDTQRGHVMNIVREAQPTNPEAPPFPSLTGVTARLISALEHLGWR